MTSSPSAGSVSVRGLGKRYVVPGERPSTAAEAFIGFARARRRRREAFWALDDVTFEVSPGEAVALIGANGAGKSTLLKILARITPPTRGEAVVAGTVSALLEVGTGFHPELTGRENIYLNGSIIGLSRREISKAFDEIVDFAGVNRFLDLPVKRYSSGMVMRLGFAVAASLTSPVLIIDEVLAVGDANFQARCLGRMAEARTQGRTLLFVSHNVAAVRGLCSRGIVLKSGRVVFDGAVGDALHSYLGSFATTSVSMQDGMVDISRDSSGAVRPHLRAVRISQDDGRRSAEMIAVGASLCIEVDVDNWNTVTRPVLAISVWNEGGLLVTALVSSYTSANLEAHNKEARYRIRVEVPHLSLMPGRYALDVGVRRQGEDDFDLASRCTSFTVIADDFFGSGQFPQPGEGVVLVDQTWTIERIVS